MQIRPTTRWLSLLAIPLTALALSACGDDDDDSGSAAEQTTTTEQAAGGKDSAAKLPSGVKGGNTLELAVVEDLTVPELRFSEERATVDAGPVTVTMRSPDDAELTHAIEIEGKGVEEKGKVVEGGGTSTAKANLKPGKYVFYCPVGAHRREGMKGTLTVR